MAWHKLRFHIDADLVEPISNILEAFLAQSITTENAGENEFFEAAFPGTPDWKSVYVSALFIDSIDIQPIIEFVQSHLPVEYEIPTEHQQLVDQDWQRVCLKQFSPIKVGTNLWVCPSWCEAVEPDARNITLDPGLAFGTGTHPTTKVCLQWLSDHCLSNKTVLDFGCGSGVLAIASLLSDARQVTAVDIDPMAVSACKENAVLNKVDDKLVALLPSDLKDIKYDLVIANILSDTIIELKDVLLSHLKPDSTLLLSGILPTQAKRVMTAFKNEVIFTQQNHEQWCLLIGIDHGQ